MNNYNGRRKSNDTRKMHMFKREEGERRKKKKKRRSQEETKINWRKKKEKTKR